MSRRQSFAAFIDATAWHEICINGIDKAQENLSQWRKKI